MWITTTVIIVVYYDIGIGTFLRWIPTSLSVSSDTPLAAAATNQTPTTHTAQADVVGDSSDRIICSDCGVIESIREINKYDAAGGLGIVSGDRISTRAYGEANSIASNETTAGRRLNRRVEIILSGDNGSITPR